MITQSPKYWITSYKTALQSDVYVQVKPKEKNAILYSTNILCDSTHHKRYFSCIIYIRALG